MRNSVVRENIRPEVLANLKSFFKIFRNAHVGFCDWKIIYE